MSTDNKTVEATGKQKRLFKGDNPLEQKVGADFFERLPDSPGIYKMYSRLGNLLYVGKAKNLRKRLFQYKQNGRGEGRKRNRLVRMTAYIEVEMYETELEALLRENKLLRQLKPEFNVAKTHPESYYFIGLSHTNGKLVFDLSMHYVPDRHDWIYGAFKGHTIIRNGLGALLRQLWLYYRPDQSVLSFPPVLTRRLTADHFELELPEKPKRDEFAIQVEDVCNFLRGEKMELVERLTEELRTGERLDDFQGKFILEDLDVLKRFYERCTQHNYLMYQKLGLDSPCIPQNRLDDCLVRYAFAEEEDGDTND